MNKRQVLPYNLILTYIQMTTLATFFLFPPNLGGGNKGHLIADSPPPTYSRGVGQGVACWVLRPCQRTGGGGGQGTALTNDNFILQYLTSQAHLSRTLNP